MEAIKNLPVSEYMHDKIVRILRENAVHTVVDIGGIGKLKNKGFVLVDANLKGGLDGTSLPFEDRSFDASVSINTLEHVKNQEKFIEESIRVARKGTFHFFLYGEIAEKTEMLKKQLGHRHPYRMSSKNILKRGNHYPFCTVSEHLLTLATLYPKLNVRQLYDFIEEYGKDFYGVIFWKLKQ